MKGIFYLCVLVSALLCAPLDEKIKDVEVDGELILRYEKQDTKSKTLKRKPKESELNINVEFK